MHWASAENILPFHTGNCWCSDLTTILSYQMLKQHILKFVSVDEYILIPASSAFDTVMEPLGVPGENLRCNS